MAPTPVSTPDPPPAALAAFLRGCERRGAVFASLQCGDPDRGDVALAAALRAFRAKATTLPLAEWPVRFWALLVATPQLRGEAADAHWPVALAGLAVPSPADRAALLLRLAGGLQEAEAAQVLGIDDAAYRDALARACPRDALGHPDAAAWRAVAEAIQQQLRDLPADRLAELARLREDALVGTRVPPVVAKERPAAAARGPRRWPWILLGVVLLLAGAGAALWWWQGPSLRLPTPQSVATADESAPGVSPDPVIGVAELPPADTPAASADAETPPEAHPDFLLLADADEEAHAREADLLAWHLASASEAQASATTASESGATDAAH